jgi:hypothetical protein
MEAQGRQIDWNDTSIISQCGMRDAGCGADRLIGTTLSPSSIHLRSMSVAEGSPCPYRSFAFLAFLCEITSVTDSQIPTSVALIRTSLVPQLVAPAPN